MAEAEEVGAVPNGPAQPDGMDADKGRLLMFVREEEQEKAQAEQQSQPEGAREADEILDDDSPKLTPEQAVLGLLEVIFIPVEQAGMQRVMSIWTPETQEQIAKRLVAVLSKYIWGRRVLAFLQDGLGVEEMALLMLLYPLIKETMAAGRADVADIRAAKAKAANA